MLRLRLRSSMTGQRHIVASASLVYIGSHRTLLVKSLCLAASSSSSPPLLSWLRRTPSHHPPPPPPPPPLLSPPCPPLSLCPGLLQAARICQPLRFLRRPVKHTALSHLPIGHSVCESWPFPLGLQLKRTVFQRTSYLLAACPVQLHFLKRCSSSQLLNKLFLRRLRRSAKCGATKPASFLPPPPPPPPPSPPLFSFVPFSLLAVAAAAAAATAAGAGAAVPAACAFVAALDIASR